MKKFFTLMLLLFGFTALYAQEQKNDIIVKQDGTKLEVVVTEVDVDVVKYKLANNPTGPVYTVKKTDIATILYANGTTDVFKQQPQQVVYQQYAQSTTQQPLNLTGDELKAYNSAKAMNAAGAAVAGIGAALMVPGIILGILVNGVFLYSMLPAGGAMLIAGSVISGVGAGKMRAIENNHRMMSLYDVPLGKNHKNSVSLSVYSNGLSLRF